MLPNYRNLKKLKLKNCGEVTNLIQIIQNNPKLESLILEFDSDWFQIDEMMMIVAENLKHLMELHLMGDEQKNNFAFPFSTSLIVDSLKNLQSLKICVSDHHLKLIQQLGMECKNLTHLALVRRNYWDENNFSDEMIDAIRQFDGLERLELTQWKYDDRMESLIECLPNLRQLQLSMVTPCSNTFILALLRMCPSFEIMTVDSITEAMPKFLEFFNEVVEIMQKPNAKVVFKDERQMIGYVTKEEIVWNNKLMHWIGYDPIYNTSNINLFDLAKPSVASPADEKRSPFDHICDYLDLNSLQELSTASKRSNELVENYVKRHAQQNGTFTISDEFHCDANGLDAFASHVENLKLIIFDEDFLVHLNMVAKNYIKLNKLRIYANNFHLDLSNCSFPRVRHMIFNSDCINLGGISRSHPNIETLEIQTSVDPCNFCSQYSLEFRNLKKFKCNVRYLLEMIWETYENTITELIPTIVELNCG